MNALTQPTIIVGAGFAGLFTALHLRHQRYVRSIILIDPQSRFVFKPMLYELLTDELSEDTVCPTYQELLEGSDITFVQDQVTAIDLKQNRVSLASGQDYTYEHLVLTVGSSQGYLGTTGAEEHAYPFRTREEALALEKHLRACLSKASHTTDEQQRRSLLTFAIVGAGPSGVEMAATLADLLPYWYAKQGGDIHEIHIVLINHGKHILQGDVNTDLKEFALHSFRTRTVPVELRMESGVKAVYPDRIEIQPVGSETTETLHTQTTIWTAGTAVNPLIKKLAGQIPAEHLDKHGLPLVTPTLQLLDYPSVFAAGDCVEVQGHRQPALAQIAYQQGATIAHNLIALSKGETLEESYAGLRGTLMKLGINNAIANLFDKVQITGKPGDVVRNVTYLEMLPTPWHDFRATQDWIQEEIFNRYQRPKVLPEGVKQSVLTPIERRDRNLVKALAIGAPLVFLIFAIIGLRTPSVRQPLPASPSPSQTTTPR